MRIEYLNTIPLIEYFRLLNTSKKKFSSENNSVIKRNEILSGVEFRIGGEK